MAKAQELARRAKESVDALAEVLETAEVKAPKAQTKATAKYQQEHGYTTKSFKLDAQQTEVARQWIEFNQKIGVAQSAALEEMMTDWMNGELKAAPCQCWWCKLMRKLGRA